ncbi:SDR family oxidoreductase [Thalassomonas actiniarum]|uniref:NAD(P)-dependent oxidoreductase n=1 Tax=Thalassomonas actiniarum TaxID=485447 RepID=A0AAF0C1T4_9GAMM|nr:NAD(P)-dependent oxidoreductase [Thalassomonas actiniarum]WDD97090.1 NAD(P)-dependent oxidoreductase [Thalassomonas actiniarum]
MTQDNSATSKALQGKTIIITGGSRGIGREIALKAAADGANIVIASKSDTPHDKLPGTIHSVAEEVEQAGGKALAIKVDVRDEQSIYAMVEQTVGTFGGIDALINNAGAIHLRGIEETPIKRFDLMHAINERAVLLCTQAVLPHLKKSENGHIISMSPPISLKKHWLKPHIAYTVTKYGMSLLTMGLAEELKEHNIAVNSLWPKTAIATAAVEYAIDAKILPMSRTPAIMADAAYEILTSKNLAMTGQTLIDEDVLRAGGQTEFDHYKVDPNCDRLFPDLFVDLD